MDENEGPKTDAEKVRIMTRVIDQVFDEHWSDIDGLWMQDIRPAFGDEVTDEEFMNRVALPITMKLLSVGLRAGIAGTTAHTKVFDKPYEFVVAPSGMVSLKFHEED